MVTVVKPGGNQSITIHLDGATKLDLSAIANEKITLVHVGDRLIILFDNHAEVTIEPFYSDNGQPLPDVTVELGPNHDVTSAQFAADFPITTDQSVLPASGGPNSISSGADFVSFSIDTFGANGTPLDLLGSDSQGNQNQNGQGQNNNGQQQGSVETLTGATVTAAVFEGGLVTDAFNLAGGNSPGAAVTATGVAGSLNALVDFGRAGPGTAPFQFVSPTAAHTWLAHLDLTSHGVAIDTATITNNAHGETLAAFAGATEVFTLTINSNGSWTFTLLAPLDDGPNQHESAAAVDLSGLIQAVDAHGHTLTLSNDFTITVNDDNPLLNTGTVVTGTVEDSALTSPPDAYGTGSGALGGLATASGSLVPLVAFGADGPAANGFHFVSQGLAQTLISGLGLTSHGNAIDAVNIVGDTLTALDSTHTTVFTLTVAGNGDYTFTLLNPIDNPTGPGPQIQFFNFDLSGLVQATDFDGSTIPLSQDFAINASNDVPFQTNFGGTTLQVFEQGFTQGTPGDLYGTGQFAGAANVSQTGNLNTFLGFNFGAEGEATIGGKPAGYQITFADDTVHDIGVASHGQDVDFFTVTAPVIDPTHGVTQTMTAWTNGGPTDPTAHEVFTLTVSGDGDFTFTIINPIDMPATAGTPNTFPIDLSPYISATDAVGDKVPIAPGTFLADVTGDVPLPTTNVVTGSVDEGALTTATDTESTQDGNDPKASASATGSLLSLVNFGANGQGVPAFGFSAFALNTDTAAVGNALAAQSLTSHGSLINQVTINGSTLTALDQNGDHVFNLTINPDGTSYTFTLLEPIDQLTGSNEKTVTIDLSSALTAFDFDGDTMPTNADGSFEGLADFTITVTDDVPTSAPGASLTGAVNEGPAESGHPNPNVQAVTGGSGALTALFSFGADGPPATGAAVAAVGTSAAQTWIANLHLTSHGNDINIASESTVGNDTFITARDSTNADVFSVIINTDGAYQFHLLGQIDQASVNGTATVDLSGLVQAQDFDGDFGTLANGTWTVSVADDRPVVSAVLATGNENTPNPPSTISPNAAPIQVTLSATDGDPNATISFTVTSLPADGTLFTDAALTNAVAANTAIAASGATLTLYFEPNAFFAGTDSFQYSATDSNGADSPTAATATIDVTPVADPPALTDSAQVALAPADSNTPTSTELVPLSGGGFATIWQVSNGLLTNTVLTQAFDAGGHPIGTSVTLSTAATGTGQELLVALNGGGYAVTWTVGDDIFTQAFHADGSVNGATQQIDTAGQANTAIQLSALDNGGYAVLYERVDAGHEDVFTRVFGADGTPDPVGETQVNTVPPGDGSDNLTTETGEFATPQPVQMATLANGDYVIAWSSQLNGQTVQLVRVFDDHGNPVTNESQVSTPPAGDNDGGFNGASGGLVTALANGDFAVAWERARPDGSTDILTKVYHASNSYAGEADVTVTAGGTNTENVQQVVGLSTGGYAVMWSGGTLGNVHTFVQVYDANGHLADTNPADANGIQVDSLVGTGNTTAEQVLALAGGHFAVMWQGGSEADPFVRVFNADGSPVGDGTPIAATPGTATTLNSGIQMVEFADGTFAAVYDQTVNGGSGATATSQDHLFVQHFDASGNAVGAALELVSSPFTGASLPELSNFDDFRLALSNEGLLSAGGTTNDNGSFNINLGSTDTAIGIENAPIALFNASMPPDSFETLKITITGVPTGAIFQIDGNTVGDAGATPGTWVISDPAQTALLATSPLQFVSSTAGTFTLHVDAQSTDTATLSTGPSTSTADTQQDFTVTVADANDVTLSNPASVTTMAGGGAVSLGIGAPVDADNGNDLTITLTAVPSYGTVQDPGGPALHAGAVLSAAELQALTFSAPLGTNASTGDVLDYTVQDGPNSVLGTVALNVAAGAAAPIVTNLDTDFAFTPTGDNVRDLHTVALTGGGFVATWDAGPTGSEQVFAQTFDAHNQPIGGPALIASPTTGPDGPQSNVVALEGGGYAVAWRDGTVLWTETFDANGNSTGGPNGATDQDNFVNVTAQPLVALANGDFAVVFDQNDSPPGTDDVYARIFDANDTAVTGLIHLNAFDVPSDIFQNVSTPITRDIAQVVATAHGFVVMWESTSDDGSGTPAEHTYVRVVNSDGTFASSPIEVNAPSGSNADDPAQVISLGGDDFAVMWQETTGGVTDTLTRIFKASDNYAGTTEIVTGAGSAGNPATPEQIVELANGGYAALWSQGGASADVFAQAYDANGHLTGATPSAGIQVDTGAAAGFAFADAIVALSGGGFAVEYDNLSNVFVSTFDAQGHLAAGGQVELANSPSATLATAAQTGMVALQDGGFEALWDQTVSTANGAQDQIWAQRFDANGNTVGAAEELFATTSNLSNQTETSIINEFKTAFADGTLLTGAISNDSGTDSTSTPFNNNSLTLDFTYTASGAENTPIALFNVLKGAPTDTISSVTITTSNFLNLLPAGTTFAINGVTAGSLVGNQWVINDPAQIALLATSPLTIVPPPGFAGDLSLELIAVESKTLGAQTSSVSLLDVFNVTVTDANDVTLGNPSAVAVLSGSGAVSLGIGAPSDPDQAAHENDVITIQAVPAYGLVQYTDLLHQAHPVTDGTVLSLAELATLTYTPPASGPFNGDSIVYSVQDGASLVDGSIAITVSDPTSGLYFSADATSAALNPDLFVLGPNSTSPTAIPINPPNGSSAGEDGGFIQFANQLYFFANTATTGEALFHLGADNVAHPVIDANGDIGAAGGGINANFSMYDGSLYFVGQGSLGTDLFKIDPTGAVTEINVNPGANAFDQNDNFGLTEFDGKLFFTAYSSASTNFDRTAFFAIDPNSNAAHEVQYNGHSLDNAGEDGGFFAFNGSLFFNAFDPTFGDSLFVLDANDQPTLVMSGGFPIPHVTGETTYFQTLGSDMYVTEETSGSIDGLFQVTPGGTFTEVQYNGTDSFDFTTASQRGLGGLAEFNGNIYFSADTPTTDAQLGVAHPVLFQLSSAGTPSEVLFNGHPVVDAGEDGGFFTFNNHLYFFADDATTATGAGLFQMNSGGTVTELTDPTSGSPFGGPTNAHFTVFDGSLYLEAFTGKGDELVQIDSTGTPHVIDINPAVGPPIGSSFPGENGGFGVYTPITTVFGTSGNDTFALTDAQFQSSAEAIQGEAGSNTLVITDAASPITIADAGFLDIQDVQTLELADSAAASVTLGLDASKDVAGSGSPFTLDDHLSSGALTLDASGLNADLTVLLGTSGNDTLSGGSAANTYQFDTAPSQGNDQITNFTTGKDAVAVSAAGFGGGLFAGEDVTTVFESSGNNQFTSTSDRFHFDTTNQALYYSLDGTTSHEVLLATVTNGGGVVNPHDIHVVA